MNSFRLATRHGRVGLRLSVASSINSRRIITSGRGVTHIIFGLLDGTLGCAPTNNSVFMSLGSRSKGFHLSIQSANGNVSRRRTNGVFRHFFRTGKTTDNANVNLTLIGSFMRLRRNRTHMRDRLNGKSSFVIIVPHRRRSGSLIVRASVSGISGSMGASLSRDGALVDRPRLRCVGSKREGDKGMRRLLDRRTGGPAILIVSSGGSVHRCRRALLRSSCVILRTTSNGRKLSITGGRIPSLIVYSIVVPIVSNLRFARGLGARATASRVPIVVLATGGLRRRHTRNCRRNTSSCVAGPFRDGMLLTHVRGLLGRHGLLGRLFRNAPRTRLRVTSSRLRSHSGRFVGRLRTVVRGGLSSDRFNIRGVNGRVNLDHIRLCHGIGTVANSSIMSLLHGTHLTGTGHLLRSHDVDISRMTCSINFSTPSCFAGYFGSRCNVLPKSMKGMWCSVVWLA